MSPSITLMNEVPLLQMEQNYITITLFQVLNMNNNKMPVYDIYLFILEHCNAVQKHNRIRHCHEC